MQYLWHYKSQIFGYFQTKKNQTACASEWMLLNVNLLFLIHLNNPEDYKIFNLNLLHQTCDKITGIEDDMNLVVKIYVFIFVQKNRVDPFIYLK